MKEGSGEEFIIWEWKEIGLFLFEKKKEKFERWHIAEVSHIYHFRYSPNRREGISIMDPNLFQSIKC